jgi:predicted ester cyclase
MKKPILLAATLACAVATGCGGKTKNTGEPPATGMNPPAGGDMSSAPATGGGEVSTGAGATAETKAPPPPPPPKPKTPEELAARYQECWGFWNDAKYDDFKGCYAADATAEAPGSGMPASSGPDAIVEQSKMERTGIPDLKGELQLVLQNGNHTVGVALLKGTQTDTLKTPMGDIPPSKKKVGFLMGHVIDFNDQGMATKEWAFFDAATMMSQIGASKMPARKAMDKGAAAPEVVIAKGDDAEKANLATFQALTDAFNKHDTKALGEMVGDKVVWSEAANPKDMTKKDLMKMMPQMWKGFSDLHFTVKDSWAAGPYVVAIESFDGTNDGDLPQMKMKKTGKTVSSPFLAIHKFEGGKNTVTMIFYQGMDFATQLGMPMPAPGGAAKGKGKGK